MFQGRRESNSYLKALEACGLPVPRYLRHAYSVVLLRKAVVRRVEMRRLRPNTASVPVSVRRVKLVRVSIPPISPAVVECKTDKLPATSRSSRSISIRM